LTVTLTPGRAVDGFSVIEGDRPALAAGGLGELALPALTDGYPVNAGVGVALLDADAAPADEVGVVVGLGFGLPLPPEMLVGVRGVVLRLAVVLVERGDVDNVAVGEGGVIGVAVTLGVAEAEAEAVAVAEAEAEAVAEAVAVAVAVLLLTTGPIVLVLVVAVGSGSGAVGSGAMLAPILRASGVAVPPTIVLPTEVCALR